MRVARVPEGFGAARSPLLLEREISREDAQFSLGVLAIYLAKNLRW